MRSGQVIYDSLCDKLKGDIDVNINYDSNMLINLFKDRLDFTLEDLIAWIFQCTDLLSSDNTYSQRVTSKINQFMVDNPCGNMSSPSLVVGAEGNAQLVYKYYHMCATEEKEILKQSLCTLLLQGF